MTYPELVKSNWGFISSETQKKVHDTRILLCGCGLGSNIALLAARTGFTKFILADGDIVSRGNLNRQAFRVSQVGRNKAQMTAEILKEVNPQIETEIFPNFIKSALEVETLTSKADMVVNMVDPGEVMFQINKMATAQKKPVFFPMNVGFGAVIMKFTHESARLEDLIPPTKGAPDEFFLVLVEKMKEKLPTYLLQYMGVLDDLRKEQTSIPQLGIAAGINASLMVTAMIKTLVGEPMPLAPQPITLDSWAAGT